MLLWKGSGVLNVICLEAGIPVKIVVGRAACGLGGRLKSNWAHPQTKSIRSYFFRASILLGLGSVQKSAFEKASQTTLPEILKQKLEDIPEAYPFILCRGHSS